MTGHPFRQRYVAIALALAVLALARPLPLATTGAEEITSDNDSDKNAPHTLSLSLKDAVALALDNNLSVVGKQIEWKIADTDIDAATAQYDPVFYGEGYAGESKTPGTSVPLLGGLLGGEPTTEKKRRGRMGIQGRLEPGTIFDLYYSTERTETDTEFLLFAPFNPLYDTKLNLSLTQPLLRKAWPKYGTADERMARNSRSRAHMAIAQTAEALVADVESAYWDLVAALNERAVRLKSLELAMNFRQTVRDKLKNGHATQVDLHSADTEIAMQHESLAIVEQQIRDWQNRLRHLVVPFKYPLAETVAITPLDRPAVLVQRLNIGECIQQALKNRREIQMKDIELENAGTNLDKADSELLPDLKLKLTGSATSSIDGYGRSVSEVFDVEYPQWEAGFYFEVPLGNTAAWAAYRRRRYEQELLKLERCNLEQQIALEVKEAANAFDTAFVRIDSLSKSLDLAVKRYAAEKERFEQQHSTAYQVLQMYRDIVQAQVNLEKAKVESNKAYSRLGKACGTLLASKDVYVP